MWFPGLLPGLPDQGIFATTQGLSVASEPDLHDAAHVVAASALDVYSGARRSMLLERGVSAVCVEFMGRTKASTVMVGSQSHGIAPALEAWPPPVHWARARS